MSHKHPTEQSETETDELLDFEAAIGRALANADQQDAEEWDEPDADDPNVFHASELSRCPRQCYLAKHDLKDYSDAYGVLRSGTLLHEFIEEQMPEVLPECRFEIEGSMEVDGMEFRGRADMIDPPRDALYDHKTRGGWYNFDPPNQRHLDQLYIYMMIFGMSHGRVFYISRKDFEVRPYPEDDTVQFDADRWVEIVDRAREVRDATLDYGVAEEESEIPFDKCGNWLCSSETLDFD
jgi:hypothetical protein